MRALIREAQYRPLAGGNKIIIFDEFHQVSKDAQEALLKITEEPPKHLYFIFCSTDPKKIKMTIRNRCNEISLREVSDKEIVLILKNIAIEEEIEWTDTLKEIGRLIVGEASGIPRNAVKLFDRLRNCENIEVAKRAIRVIEETENSLYPLFIAVLKRDLTGMIENTPKDVGYEGIRIAIARMLTNKMRKEPEKAMHYAEQLSWFTNPVDDRFGDIELFNSYAGINQTTRIKQ